MYEIRNSEKILKFNSNFNLENSLTGVNIFTPVRISIAIYLLRDIVKSKSKPFTKL